MEKHGSLKKAQRQYAKSIIEKLPERELPLRSADITLKIEQSACFEAADGIFAYSSVEGEPDLSALFAAAARLGKLVFLPVCGDSGRMIFCDVTDVLLAPGAGALSVTASRREIADFIARFPSRRIFSGEGFRPGIYGILEPDPARFPVFSTAEPLDVSSPEPREPFTAEPLDASLTETQEPSFPDLRDACFEGKALILCPGLAFDQSGNRLGRGKGFFDRFLARRRSLFGSVCGVCYRELVFPSVAVLPHDVRMDHIFCDGD